MPRDHFSKTMRSPRFHSDAYKESVDGKIEAKVELFLSKMWKAIKIWKK